MTLNKKELIDQYIAMLLEVNQSINLSGATTYDEFLNRHINDSLALLEFIELKASDRVLDMGTGAGFPAIPLAILTEANFVLVDSLNKRINFLNDVCDALGLSHVRAIHARAEEFLRMDEYREGFDIVTSRAVAPLNLLLEYTIPALKVGGKFYAYKSCAIEGELAEAEQALSVLNAELSAVFDYTVTDGQGQSIDLKILEITKLDSTADKYPRRVGIPAKRPLK